MHAPAVQVASETVLMRAAPAPVQTATGPSISSTASRPISGVAAYQTRGARRAAEAAAQAAAAQDQATSPPDTMRAAAAAPTPGAVEDPAKPVASAPRVPTPVRRLA